MRSVPPAELTELVAKPVELIKWLEQQDGDRAVSIATTLFEQLLHEAAQPRSVSGKACIRLCGLVDQSIKSTAECLRLWALSQDVTLKLFDFYIEWNESDNHRSMKLVLDLVALSILKNLGEENALATTRRILDNLVSIIIGRSTKPVAKSAIKTLEHFLSKDVLTLEHIKTSFLSFRPDLSNNDDIEVWRNFTVEIFQWLRLHFVCPTAGRLLVCIYSSWQRQQDVTRYPSIDAWYQWLMDFLGQDSSLLESIKNYIFLPLFKADRVEALKFLSRMNTGRTLSTASNAELDTSALLRLAALETGKRVGLVEEPNLVNGTDEVADSSSITLHEQVLESVLSHPSHEVRTLALSLLVASPSTTRPYSPTAFDLLKRHLGTLFADPDAKFRVDVSANSRDMFKRVRGAIHVLKRSIPRARAKALKNSRAYQPDKDAVSQPILYRSNLISLPEAQLTHCLDYHVEFLRWYMSFLCEELIPTASYQRHIASLKATMYIIRMEGESSKTWETADDQELFFDLFDTMWARALSDLVMDPFEDVRDIAATILSKCYADRRYRRLNLADEVSTAVPVAEIEELSQRSNELARRTARADHSDGSSKASQILYRFLESGQARVSLLAAMVTELKHKTSMAEKDLGQAVIDAPLHGDFASLCHTWQVVSEIKLAESELMEVRQLQLEIASCCERAWEAVRAILCDDSPEGHLPEELEVVDGLDTKELLSYSFRAIHEASNLMRTIILTIRNRSREGLTTPSKEVFERIGNLTFTQLANLRHRGAFTTVSSTFATCCQQTKHLQFGEDERHLLKVWYEGTLNVIHTQASTTRRSAGIPSMITGILAANGSDPSFSEVMDTLMHIAGKGAKVLETDGSNLPQVHAFNCLKDIFKNSLLSAIGNKSESYLPQCLELAASGLRSEVWALRNCGLIFLRSLIDNLFGTHESKAMIEAGWDGKANRIHYHRYPNLPTVLMSLLQSGHQMLASAANTGAAAESVFPALDIIRRAGPPDLLRDEIQVHVAAYLSSPVWHVRDMAARTLCSCLLHDNWLSVIKATFKSALSGKDATRRNHIHGVLLTLRFLVERLSDVASELLLADLEDLCIYLKTLQIDSMFPGCPDITATYIDIVDAIWISQLANKLSLSPFSVNMPSNQGSALLKIQKAIYDVYSSSTDGNALEHLRTLLLGDNVGLDGLVAALETIPKVWNVESASQDTLVSLCELYIELCMTTGYSEAQVIATENLADVTDQLLRLNCHDKTPAASLVALWTCLKSRPINPALSHAIIRASGSFIAALSTSSNTSTPISIQGWGYMMADAGLDDKTFDTRFAAAQSLQSFFTVTGNSCTSDVYLPALLALYDSLNDDDDEVRQVAAAAAKYVVGDALVPIEAANRLLQLLTRRFGSAPAFKSMVADRIVGHFGIRAATVTVGRTWEPAEVQLSKAMEFDDSLFAVEEQNLFIDEVRETKRWIEAFDSLDWAADDESLVRLNDWIISGLAHLGKLAAVEDGPLGWASNPTLFAICSRLIRGSAAVVQRSHSPELKEAMASTKKSLESGNTHVSKLLTGSF